MEKQNWNDWEKSKEGAVQSLMSLSLTWTLNQLITQSQMLITKLLAPRPSLLHTSRAGLYIYLRDHNKHINPEPSVLKVSYRNPHHLFPQAPAHNFIEYDLDPDIQNLLDRQIFEEYKNKILHGIIDQEQTKEPDPLWGEEPVPVHYFSRISKIDLMRVSHPQSLDGEQWLRQHYEPYFELRQEVEISEETIKKGDVHELVRLSVAARWQKMGERELWFLIEEGLGRGKKLYLLSPEQLIQLKWAFDGLTKQGTPIFHEILASLLEEDLPRMSKDDLFALFYACRYSNPGKTNLQQAVLEHLTPFYGSLSFAEKSAFLLALSLCTKALKYPKKVQKRRSYQFKQQMAGILLQLNFWELQLSNEKAGEIVFALAKLQIDNTKFITYPVRDFISQNVDSYCQDRERLFQAIVYLPQLEAGQGVMDQQMATLLRRKAEEVWSEFSPVQQIRIVHSLWNMGLMDEQLASLYQQIELESDTTLLYYACQIEMETSSEREWQIVQCLAHLDYLPLPYYPAYQRFHNYIKATTEWDLTPLTDKLKNTENYYSGMRQEDGLKRVRTFGKMREFQDFAGVVFAQDTAPVSNLELVHFNFPLHQVSLDIVGEKQFVPGTSQLKETYMNKVRSLSNLGWKHLAFTEEQLSDLPLSQVIQNIQECYLPYVESQQEVIDYQDYKRSEEILMGQQVEELRNWELDDINQFLSGDKEIVQLGEDTTGKDDISLGEVDLNEPEEDLAPAKKKKK